MPIQGASAQEARGDLLGRQQLGGHRLPGQHVPEPEGVGVEDEQLCSDTVFQRASDEVGGQPSRGLQQAQSRVIGPTTTSRCARRSMRRSWTRPK